MEEIPVEKKPDGMLIKASRVVKILSNICFVATILTCMVFVVFTAPRLYGVSPFVVQSASMEPAIPTGSVVFVDTKDTDVEEGDIITYSLSTGGGNAVFVTHRVHKVDADARLVQTKGDNNDNADGWLDMEAITGTVVLHVPMCGFVLDALQETGFILIAIWAFAANGILMLIPHILDLLNNEK